MLVIHINVISLYDVNVQKIKSLYYIRLDSRLYSSLA